MGNKNGMEAKNKDMTRKMEGVEPTRESYSISSEYCEATGEKVPSGLSVYYVKEEPADFPYDGGSVHQASECTAVDDGNLSLRVKSEVESQERGQLGETGKSSSFTEGREETRVGPIGIVNRGVLRTLSGDAQSNLTPESTGNEASPSTRDAKPQSFPASSAAKSKGARSSTGEIPKVQEQGNCKRRKTQEVKADKRKRHMQVDHDGNEIENRRKNLCNQSAQPRQTEQEQPTSQGEPSFHILSDSRRKGDIRGVRCKKRLTPGMQFGPLRGAVVSKVEGCTSENTWELCLRGNIIFYVRGRQNNWMTHVRCARSNGEQNLEAIQVYGDVYFRTTRVVEPGSELRVFYSNEYIEMLGFTGLVELTASRDYKTFHCNKPSCQTELPTAKHMLRHIRLAHEIQPDDRMVPLVMWKPRWYNSVDRDPVAVALQKVADEIHEQRQIEIALPTRMQVADMWTCHICGKNFSMLHGLHEHQQFHKHIELIKLPPFVVGQSNDVLVSQSESANLKNTADENTRQSQRDVALSANIGEADKWVCHTCGMVFKSRIRLCLHKRIHSGEQTEVSRRPVSAGMEKKVDETPGQSQQDMALPANMGEVDKWVCQKCGKVFSTQIRLSLHEKCEQVNVTKHPSSAVGQRNDSILVVKNSSGKIVCAQCPEEFPAKDALENHLQHSHKPKGRSPVVTVQRDILKTTNVTWVYDGYSKKPEKQTQADLKSGQVVNSESPSYKCARCSTMYSTRKMLQAHERYVHGMTNRK